MNALSTTEYIAQAKRGEMAVEGTSSVVGNLLYAVAFGCTLIGFLVAWKQVVSVRQAGREKRMTEGLTIIIPSSSAVARPAYDPEQELRRWQDRAELAEQEAEMLRDELAVAQQRVRDLQDEAKLDKEDAAFELERRLSNAADDHASAVDDVARILDEARADAIQLYGEALAGAAAEAERHWRAGLTQAERDAAWDEYWQQFEEPVRTVIEEQVQWWRSLRRQ